MKKVLTLIVLAVLSITAQGKVIRGIDQDNS